MAERSAVDDMLVGDAEWVLRRRGCQVVEVVMPERDVSLLSVWEGLGRRDVRVGVEVVDDRRLDFRVRRLALVCLAAVDHKTNFRW